MNNYKRFLALSCVALLTVLLSGCGSSSSSNSQFGTLGVSLTDAPASGFDAVNVTVSSVRVHQSSTASGNDSGWSDITLTPPRKINLLNLTNGVLNTLGQTSLPAGHYTQLRLVLSANTGTGIANSVVLSGTTTEIPLFTPSATQSGIKLIHEFDVAAGQHVDLVLDFNALKSIVARGNGGYALMPVITVVPMQLTGIDGFIDASLLADNVVVSAQVGGTEVRSTTPDPLTGEFFIAYLDAGSYDVVITADNHATAVISGVPVSSSTGTEGSTITSTSALPISLPTSTMHNISGTITLNPVSTGTVAYLAAKQTFTAGPTITVKTQGADLLSGAYSLALSVGAPLLGSYGTGTLPIPLIPQTGAASLYAAEASASGYQTQSVNEDLSAGDVTQNFTLIP
jgi:Domain of unknown function (DUF4382)